MKNILFACLLLTTVATTSIVTNASAQTTTTSTTVTAADFTAKTNQLDAQIGAGDMAAAQNTWGAVREMMKVAFGASKYKIVNAATPADKDAARAAMNNQRTLYKDIFTLQSDMAANRAALHAKLSEFAATIN